MHPVWLATVLLFARVEAYLDKNGLCTKHEITCSSTCRAVAFCTENGAIPSNQGCSIDKPYCNNGICSNTYNPNCNKPSSNTVVCLYGIAGTFPDPTDCRSFYICVVGKTFRYSCPKIGFVYSTKTHSCVQENEKHRCGNAICNGKHTWTAHNIDARYYYYCNDFSKPQFMYRCFENYEFNSSSGHCEFKCKREGLFPNENNDRKYLECSKVSAGKYLITKRMCPFDDQMYTKFNPATSECELGHSARV